MSELLLHGPGAGSGPIFDVECTEHSEISKSLKGGSLYRGL